MVKLAEIYLYIFPIISFLYGTWYVSTSGFWAFLAALFFVGLWILVIGCVLLVTGRWAGGELDFE